MTEDYDDECLVCIGTNAGYEGVRPDSITILTIKHSTDEDEGWCEHPSIILQAY